MTCPLIFVTKGGVVLGLRVILYLEEELVQYFFFLGGVYIALRDLVRLMCTFPSFCYISLLYTSLVTILLHILYFIFIYMMMMYVFLHLPLHVLFLFYPYSHVFFYVCNLYFCFTHDALMSFVLNVSERQVVKVYHAVNSFLAKFFKRLQQGQIYFIIQQVVMGLVI